MVHYCEKFDPLPAVTVAVNAESVVVIRGHKYLLAARALKRPSIRAVVAAPPSSREEVSAFLARKDGRGRAREQYPAVVLTTGANMRAPRRLTPPHAPALTWAVDLSVIALEANAHLAVAATTAGRSEVPRRLRARRAGERFWTRTRRRAMVPSAGIASSPRPAERPGGQPGLVVRPLLQGVTLSTFEKGPEV